jgi:hypothetical protein
VVHGEGQRAEVVAVRDLREPAVGQRQPERRRAPRAARLLEGLGVKFAVAPAGQPVPVEPGDEPPRFPAALHPPDEVLGGIGEDRGGLGQGDDAAARMGEGRGSQQSGQKPDAKFHGGQAAPCGRSNAAISG